MNPEISIGWNMDKTVFTLPPLPKVYPFKESYTRLELQAMPKPQFDLLQEVLEHGP